MASHLGSHVSHTAEISVLHSIYTGRIQCEVLTTLPFCFSWIKKFLGQQSKIWDDSSVEKLLGYPSENLQHRWSNNLRKNLNKLHCSTGYWLLRSLFKFFLKFLDQWCWRFCESYLSNFSTKLSSQIFDCCPRNFLIQEERIGNVVSTSHWIRPVVYVSGGSGEGAGDALYPLNPNVCIFIGFTIFILLWHLSFTAPFQLMVVQRFTKWRIKLSLISC